MPSRIPGWAWVLLPSLLVFGVFAPAIGFDFVSWDDPTYLTKNPLVVVPGAGSLREHLLTPALGYPIPVTVASYRIEVALAGEPTAWLHHLVNVLLHALACALSFLVARRLGLRTVACTAAALVFALHPAVAEPVCWATGRKDLLSAVFVLGAALITTREQAKKFDAPALWLLLVLAIASKPVAAFAAGLLPLWMLMSGRSWRHVAVAFGPVLLFLAIWVPLSWLGHDAIAGQERVTDVSLVRGIWYAAGHHLGLAFGLHENAVKYLPQPWPPGFAPLIDLLPLLAMGLFAAVYRCCSGPRRRVLLRAALWSLAAYIPSSGILPLTRYLSDSYLYLPLLGLGWCIGALFDELADRTPRPWITSLAAGAVLVASLALLLPSQARWRNSTELWTSAYQSYPHDYRLCRNVGNALFESGKPSDALEAYLACSQRFGSTHFDKNVGIALTALGRRDEARPFLQRAKLAHPDDKSLDKYLR